MSNDTLHNAIIDVLDTYGPLNAKQIANIINVYHLYEKKDKSEVQPRQITARVNKYPDLFEINEGTITKLEK